VNPAVSAGAETDMRGGAVTVLESSATSLVVRWPVGDGEGRLRLSVDGPRVRVEGEVTASRMNKVTMGFTLPEDEHVFGLGERFATFDHRGHSLYSWAEEGPLGAGEGRPVSKDTPFPNGPSMTYSPVPFFHSSRGYGLHLDTTFRSELRFGDERPDAWRAAVNAKRLAMTVYVHRARHGGVEERLVVGGSSVSLDGVTLDSTGGPARRVRWRVLLLP
jgi:hypothetical protein